MSIYFKRMRKRHYKKPHTVALLSFFLHSLFLNCVGIPLNSHNPQTQAMKTPELAISTSMNYSRETDRLPYGTRDQPKSNGRFDYRNSVEFQDIFLSVSFAINDELEGRMYTYSIFQPNFNLSGIPSFGGSIKWNFFKAPLRVSLFMDAALPFAWMGVGGSGGGSGGLNYAFNPGVSFGQNYLYGGISYIMAQTQTREVRQTIYMPILLIGTKLSQQPSLNIEISSFGSNLLDLLYDTERDLVTKSNNQFGFKNIVLSVKFGWDQ